LNRIHDLHAERLLELTRAYDSDINNTSVVLLVRAAGHALLFPGDAEVESWTAMLGRPRLGTALGELSLYKASHHGSANGTPDFLWDRMRPERLTVMLSTQAGLHGLAVPSKSLVDSMRASVSLMDSRDLARGASAAVELVPGEAPRRLDF
jgi:hypothetical protein